MRALILFAAWLAAAIAAGQEIRLVGPTEPLQPREFCQILVIGLTDADLPGATVEWSPREGTTLLPARLWGGQPFLLFSGKTPGKVTITVSINAWRGNLDAAVNAARRAATLDADTLTRLVTLQREIAARYPLRSGTCVVEVAGVPPPLPPGPDPEPGPTTGTAYLLIFRHADQVSAGPGGCARQAPHVERQPGGQRVSPGVQPRRRLRGR